MKLSARILLLLVMGMLVLPVSARADVIDQDAPTNNAYMAAFSQGDLAQSFQQSSSIISGAGIFLQAGVGFSDNVTIELWDALPGYGGNLLTSGSAVGTEGSYVDVFWAPFAVIPNTTYYLVFTGNGTLGISGDVTNQYAFGQVYANPGFGSFPGFDYTFRTWTTSVPEPGSLSLLGLAGLALTVFRRRQR